MSVWRSNSAGGMLAVVDELSTGCDEFNSRYDLKSHLHSQSSTGPLFHSISDSTSLDIGGELPFCTKDNINECAAFLSQELVSIGMPSLYNGSQREPFELTRLFNATYHLLQRFQRCVKSKDDLQDSKFRAESDLEHQHVEKGRLQSQIEQLKRDLSQACLREKQLDKINKSISNKLKLEKEETKRLQTIIISRDAQYKHGMKKKEMELVKLKDRLHLLLVDKTELKIGMEVSDVLTRPDGKRGRWRSSATNVEEELYRSIMSSYEDKQKILLVENHELRQCLGDLQKEIHGLLHPDFVSDCRSPDELQLNESMVESDHLNMSYDDMNLSTNVNNGHFLMPYSLVQEDVLSDIQQKISSLKKYIRALEASESDEKAGCTKQLVIEKQATEIERLQKRLERYRCLIEQNYTQLEDSSPRTNEASTQRLDDLNSSSERDVLMHEKRQFYEQLVEFEDKKRALAEVEFHLNKERIAIELSKCQLTSLSSNSNSSVYDLQRPQSAQPTSASSRQRIYTKRTLPSTPSMTSQSSLKSSLSAERKATGSQLNRSNTGGMTSDVHKSLSLGKMSQKVNSAEVSKTSTPSKVSKQLSDSVLHSLAFD